MFFSCSLFQTFITLTRCRWPWFIYRDHGELGRELFIGPLHAVFNRADSTPESLPHEHCKDPTYPSPNP